MISRLNRALLPLFFILALPPLLVVRKNARVQVHPSEHHRPVYFRLWALHTHTLQLFPKNISPLPSWPRHHSSPRVDCFSSISISLGAAFLIQ